MGVLSVYHSGYNFYQPYHLRRLLRVAQGVMETVDPAAWRGGLLPIPQEDTTTRLPNACALYQHLQERFKPLVAPHIPWYARPVQGSIVRKAAKATLKAMGVPG